MMSHGGMADIIIRHFTGLETAHLTRFNKISTQGAPQMAVDKEANSLLRVYSYYSILSLTCAAALILCVARLS